jgi:hypothetical protein
MARRIVIVRIHGALNFIANALRVENIVKIVIAMDAAIIWRMNQ